ncbi:MAG: hypothetical protein HC889_17230 [Synechococcaceae cyanobacterium SM1_2_3]|nr:hypothetical protein [Synechococcaceae cyanobacterium SM1_2_3]
MKQPSLVLHSHDVPGYKYKMWATWNVPDKMPVSTLVDWIIWAIDHSPNLRLDNVVINCHGSPGYLHIGSGIGVNNLDPFTRLRNKGAIGTIWIVACQVSDGKYMPNACPVDSNNGPYFCSRLAAAPVAMWWPRIQPSMWTLAIIWPCVLGVILMIMKGMFIATAQARAVAGR